MESGPLEGFKEKSKWGHSKTTEKVHTWYPEFPLNLRNIVTIYTIHVLK